VSSPPNPNPVIAMVISVKAKKLLMMDEKIDEMRIVVDKITVALVVLSALHSSLQTMHNDLLKINSDMRSQQDGGND
jgi:hypothetical protein